MINLCMDVQLGLVFGDILMVNNNFEVGELTAKQTMVNVSTNWGCTCLPPVVQPIPGTKKPCHKYSLSFPTSQVVALLYFPPVDAWRKSTVEVV